MVRLRVPRAAAWLAIPLAAVAALGLGHCVFRPEVAVEANRFEELLEAAPLQMPDHLVLRVLEADGSPAAGAAVVMLEPELAIDYADADGRVQLAHFVRGPVRLQAYQPGHALLTHGPVPREELAEELRLAPREQPTLPELPPQELLRHTLVLTGAAGEPLPGALLVAHHPDAQPVRGIPTLEPGQEPSRHPVPWLALADEQGRARLEGIPRAQLEVVAYPAALPPEPAWELGRRRFEPAEDDGESQWKLAHAELTLHALPPGGLLRGERTDVRGALPLRRVPSGGVVRWPLLPPGDYRFTVEGRRLDVAVHQGSQSARFATAGEG